MFAKLIAVIGACVAAVGCATSTEYKYDAPGQAYTSNIVLVDARPELEKTPEIGSLIATNERYGIYRLGDAQTVPNRIDYFKSRLSSIDGNLFQGKDVALTHFVIVNNVQSAMRKAAISSVVGGSVGADIRNAKTLDKDLPYIEVSIELSFNGKVYASKQAVNYNAANREPALRYPVEALKVAIDRAAEDFAIKAAN